MTLREFLKDQVDELKDDCDTLEEAMEEFDEIAEDAQDHFPDELQRDIEDTLKELMEKTFS